MYTIKLDWSANRIETVARYLATYRSTRDASEHLRLMTEGMLPSENTTLKLQWQSQTISDVLANLSRALSVIAANIEHARYGKVSFRYDDLVCDQALIFAARRDIVEYLAAVELARRITAESAATDARMRDALRTTEQHKD